MTSSMSPNDTDPRAGSPLGDSFATEPSAPPSAASAVSGQEEGSDGDLAASLLADLSRAPLPAEGVKETAGHTAAAAAVGPHRPPRAQEQVGSEPAVLVNTTQPLGLHPGTAAPSPPGRAAPKAGPVDAAPRRAAKPQHTTVPGVRAVKRQRLLVGLVLAAGIAAAALIVMVGTFLKPRGGDVIVTTASPSGAAPIGSLVIVPAASAAPAAAPVAVEQVALPVPASATATAPSAAAGAGVVRALPEAPVSSGKPAGARSGAPAPAGSPAPAASSPRPPASAARPTPRPASGSFEEPDRTF